MIDTLRVATDREVVSFVTEDVNTVVRDSWHSKDDVTAGETYINGVPMWLDRDFDWGIVVEVVDRTSSAVRFGDASKGVNYDVLDSNIAFYKDRTPADWGKESS